MIHVDIGKIIKEYREKNNITQAEFGKIVGVNKQTVSKWENNLLSPSASKYFEILKIDGIAHDEESTFVYEKRIKYNVGINFLYQKINDYNSLVMFLDSVIIVYALVNKFDMLGFLIINGTYEDDNNENIDIIETIKLVDDNIILIMSEYSIKLSRNDFSHIEIVESFNNEAYAINCYLNKNNDYFQLIVNI